MFILLNSPFFLLLRLDNFNQLIFKFTDYLFCLIKVAIGPSSCLPPFFSSLSSLLPSSPPFPFPSAIHPPSFPHCWRACHMRDGLVTCSSGGWAWCHPSPECWEPSGLHPASLIVSCPAPRLHLCALTHCTPSSHGPWAATTPIMHQTCLQ